MSKAIAARRRAVERRRQALENMGPGWRDQVIPRLAEIVSTLPE